MALNLSKTGIVDGQVITAAQISQSIDALTGVVAYNITISGSFNMGSNTTGSGTYNRSLRSQTVEPLSLGASNYYTIPYFSSTGSSTANLCYSGTSPSFNPVTETLKVTNVQGTASYATTASYAANAGGTPSKYAPTYAAIDSTNYTASTNPYRINGANASMIYISQSLSDVLGLEFWSTGLTDGQIVTFNTYYQNPDLDPTLIAISGNNIDVYGFSNNVILGTPPNNSGLLSTVLPASFMGGGKLTSFSFQYVQNPVPPYMQPGWYLFNLVTIP